MFYERRDFETFFFLFDFFFLFQPVMDAQTLLVVLWLLLVLCLGGGEGGGGVEGVIVSPTCGNDVVLSGVPLSDVVFELCGVIDVVSLSDIVFDDVELRVLGGGKVNNILLNSTG